MGDGGTFDHTVGAGRRGVADAFVSTMVSWNVQVFKQLLARSIHHARVLIRQRHIMYVSMCFMLCPMGADV